MKKDIDGEPAKHPNRREFLKTLRLPTAFALSSLIKGTPPRTGEVTPDSTTSPAANTAPAIYAPSVKISPPIREEVPPETVQTPESTSKPKHYTITISEDLLEHLRYGTHDGNTPSVCLDTSKLYFVPNADGFNDAPPIKFANNLTELTPAGATSVKLEVYKGEKRILKPFPLFSSSNPLPFDLYGLWTKIQKIRSDIQYITNGLAGIPIDNYTQEQRNQYESALNFENNAFTQLTRTLPQPDPHIENELSPGKIRLPELTVGKETIYGRPPDNMYLTVAVTEYSPVIKRESQAR